MKKYRAFVMKNMASYFENQLAKRGVIIVSRELVKDIRDNELVMYVVKAKDGIINPQFELEGA